VRTFEDLEAVVAENHRPMDFEDARIGEDFLRRGVSACPAGGTAAGRRSGQLDLFGEAAVLHVRVRLRSQIDVDVDVLVVHGLTVCDGCSRSNSHDEERRAPASLVVLRRRAPRPRRRARRDPDLHRAD